MKVIENATKLLKLKLEDISWETCFSNSTMEITTDLHIYMYVWCYKSLKKTDPLFLLDFVGEEVYIRIRLCKYPFEISGFIFAKTAWSSPQTDKNFFFRFEQT